MVSNLKIIICAVVLAVVSLKKRARVNRFAFRNTLWEDLKNSTSASNGWFKQELRMGRDSFNIIADRIEGNWNQLYDTPNYNATFDVKHRVAIAIHFLTHRSSLSVTGSVFGLSKAQVHRYLHQVLLILC